jgi:hypothetical protein
VSWSYLLISNVSLINEFSQNDEGIEHASIEDREFEPVKKPESAKIQENSKEITG